MLVAVKKLNSAIKAVKTLNVNLKKDIQWEGDFKRSENCLAIKDAYLKLLSVAYELRHLRYNSIPEIKNLYDARNFTKRMFEMIVDEKSAIQFVEYLYSITNSIANYLESDRLWGHDFDYEWRIQMNEPAFHTHMFEILAENIKLSVNRKINILDPRCGNGKNISELNECIKNIGIETECFAISQRSFVDQERASIDRLIYEGEKRVSVTKNVFDVVFSIPEVVLEEDSLSGISRYNFLNQYTSYLKPEGIFIVGIPFYRITDYFLIQLLKSVENVQWIPANEEIVFIFGQKRNVKLNSKDIDIQELEKLKNIIDIFEDMYNFGDEFQYRQLTLPDNCLEVERFRGGKITDYEIEQNCMSSQSMQEFLKSQEVDMNTSYKQKPLLPFTLGQIGLILTSGFLDGVIDEGGGYKHVVKGQVKKYLESKNEVEAQKRRMNVEEVSSNRVEINLFLPDGTFKSLI